MKSYFQPLLLAPVLLAILFICAGCSSNSSTADRPLNPQERSGRALFQADCALCHNPYKNEPLQGPPLVGVFRKKELPSGMPATDRHVRDTVKLGRRNMPAFNALLDDQQIDDLLAYLHTL